MNDTQHLRSQIKFKHIYLEVSDKKVSGTIKIDLPVEIYEKLGLEKFIQGKFKIEVLQDN
jgi:hypothetical protein